MNMKNKLLFGLVLLVAFTSCGQYNKLLKSSDMNYKYEAAKAYYAEGKYSQASTLLNSLVTVFKGTDKAEESLYMLGMCYYNKEYYQQAYDTFKKYYTTYPKGSYSAESRFYAGKSLADSTPEARLDQSSTYLAIQELQQLLEYFPRTDKKDEAQDIIFELEDKLVEKEFLSAKLYYDLGNYMGINNYESCVITAQNALKNFPYTHYREELAILILRSKYQSAQFSVEYKKAQRYRDVADECYAFKVDFPDSKYLKEADGLLDDANKQIAKLPTDQLQELRRNDAPNNYGVQ